MTPERSRPSGDRPAKQTSGSQQSQSGVHVNCVVPFWTRANGIVKLAQLEQALREGSPADLARARLHLSRGLKLLAAEQRSRRDSEGRP